MPAAKRERRKTDEGTALTSFRDLLRHLATQTLNSVTTPVYPNYCFTVTAKLTYLETTAITGAGSARRRASRRTAAA